HESKHSKAVVDRHDDDALRRHALAVVARLRSIAAYKTAAVEINEHGQSLARGFRGCPNVEIETVFTYAVRTEDHVVEDPGLHTAWAKVGCLSHAFPVSDRLRFAPTPVAFGWLREWNASEDANARRLRAASVDSAVSSLDQISGLYCDSTN